MDDSVSDSQTAGYMKIIRGESEDSGGAWKSAELLAGMLASHCVSVGVSGQVRLGVAQVDQIDIVAIPRPVSWEEQDSEEHWSGAQEALPYFIEDTLAELDITGKGRYRSGEFQGRAVVVHLMENPSAFCATLLLSTGPKAFSLHMKGYAQSIGFCLHQSGLYVQVGSRYSLLCTTTEQHIFKMLQMDYIPPTEREDLNSTILDNLDQYKIRQYDIGSKSDKKKKYTVTNSGGLSGHWECSCPDWMYRRSIEVPPARCKHIDEVISTG